MPAGTKANASGQGLEDTIEAALAARGYEVVRSSDWDEARLYRDPDPHIAVLDAPYISIYGHRAKIEFLLIHGDRQILIEVKRMRSSGSYDEKLPYVFANALANMPDREFLLIMDGEGWRDGARAWIEKQAALTAGFDVIRPDGFGAWLDTLD